MTTKGSKPPVPQRFGDYGFTTRCLGVIDDALKQRANPMRAVLEPAALGQVAGRASPVTLRPARPPFLSPTRGPARRAPPFGLRARGDQASGPGPGAADRIRPRQRAVAHAMWHTSGMCVHHGRQGNRSGSDGVLERPVQVLHGLLTSPELPGSALRIREGSAGFVGDRLTLISAQCPSRRGPSAVRG